MPVPVQAAILTGRRAKTAITLVEIDDSVDRIVAGMEGTPMTDGKSKSLVAYHEVGHAVCGTLTPGHDQVQKVAFLHPHVGGCLWQLRSRTSVCITRIRLPLGLS